MPFHLETSSGKYKFKKGTAIVVDKKGHHYSNNPIPISRAVAQMRALYLKVKN